MQTLLAVILFAATWPVSERETARQDPLDYGVPIAATNVIDALVHANLQKHGLVPAAVCSDEVFFRRVHLDLLGILPEPRDVVAFLNDHRADKRVRCIDALLRRDEFSEYWSMKWCDLLRVKAEFPINLWPNAVQAYHRWIREAIQSNMPYDAFARALLTSSGSNFRTPPVNFYRAVQGKDPTAIAGAVALTFMGTRLDAWPEQRRADMAAFFSRLVFKETDEWKEEIVCLDPAPADPLDAVLPDGTRVRIASREDPRIVFADWLIAPDNEWFARNIVNRVWSWLLGRGIIHEPDDIRPDNPPVNPELLAYLETELIQAGYDLRHIYRIILNSATYQQSAVAPTQPPEAEALFACYPVRRLEAEVLRDLLNSLFGARESYASMIPEPFTHIPEHHRAVALADGSITSAFLETFGRPARDTGLESERSNQPTDAQRLYLLNSSEVQRSIANNRRIRQILASSRGNPRRGIDQIYLGILSRFPTEDEVAAVMRYASAGQVTPQQAAEDLVWALINSKEFLYRH